MTEKLHEEFKQAIDEGVKTADRFEKALMSVGIEKRVIDNTTEQIKVKDILKEPMKLVYLLKELDIPISKYVGGLLNNPLSKDFIWEKLTPKGAERIMEMGRKYEREGKEDSLERAEMLVDIGRNKGIAALYTELTILDLVKLYNYEKG